MEAGTNNRTEFPCRSWETDPLTHSGGGGGVATGPGIGNLCRKVGGVNSSALDDIMKLLGMLNGNRGVGPSVGTIRKVIRLDRGHEIPIEFSGRRDQSKLVKS